MKKKNLVLILISCMLFSALIFTSCDSNEMTPRERTPRPSPTETDPPEETPEAVRTPNPARLGDENNILLGPNVEVEVSSDVGSSQWNAEFLIDHSESETALGWSSHLPGEMDESQEQWIVFDFGSNYNIYYVYLYPRQDTEVVGDMTGEGFPLAYRIEVSNDGEQWTEVFQDDNAEMPTTSDPVVIVLPENVTGRYWRLYATELRELSEGLYRMQFFQIKIFGSGR